MSVLPACMCTCMFLIPKEVTTGCQVPWNWSYRCSRATMWVLRLRLGPSAGVMWAHPVPAEHLSSSEEQSLTSLMCISVTADVWSAESWGCCFLSAVVHWCSGCCLWWVLSTWQCCSLSSLAFPGAAFQRDSLYLWISVPGAAFQRYTLCISGFELYISDMRGYGCNLRFVCPFILVLFYMCLWTFDAPQVSKASSSTSVVYIVSGRPASGT